MNIIYCSQFSDSCGYAVAARGYLKSLDSVISKNNLNINLKILDVSVESISKLNSDELHLLKKYSLSTEEEIQQALKSNYICLWHYPTGFYNAIKHYKNEHKKMKWLYDLIKSSKKNINYTTWEADKIPEKWVEFLQELNTCSVIVPCNWNKQIFSKQLNIPIHVLHHSLKEKEITTSAPLKQLENVIKDKFVIFSMSQWQKRKGFDKLIQAYCMEFKNQKDVLLIIKTYGVLMGDYASNKEDQKRNISQQILGYRNSVFLNDGTNPQAAIVLIADVLPYENIAWIYNQSHLFSLLTRGEGFGLTIAEAALNKVPIMVPNSTGHMDFVDKDNSFLVDSYQQPYTDIREYSCDMNWMESDLLSARSKIREAYNLWKEDPIKLKNMGKNQYNYIKSRNFTPENIGNILINIFETCDG